MTSDFSKFTTYTRRFFSGTLLSRFSGMFRDMAMAFAFGDDPQVAAFMIAFRFSQFFRRIFGEGSLQSTFIPHFEQLRLKSEKQASFFFKDLTFYLSSMLSIIILACCLLLNFSTELGISSDYKEILSLTSWMMPSLLFVCLYALNAAALQCHGSFFLAGFAPVLCNFTWIAACFILKSISMQKAMLYFSIFVVIGFFLQWAVTLPKLLKKLQLSFKEWFTLSFELPKDDIKKLSKAFVLATIGVGASQINSTLDAVFAHISNVKGPIYLWYAIRIEQLPLALFGIALISAITPSLSRAIKENNIEDAKHLFAKAKKRLSVFMIACTFGLIALGVPGITLIFKHGKFHEEAIYSTAKCLYAYGIGLFPATLVMLYSAVFYAFGDFKTPTRASLYSVLLNVILNALFVLGFDFQETSVAFATSLSSIANVYLLQRKLKQVGFNLKGNESIKKEDFKTTLAATGAIAFTFLMEKLCFNTSIGFVFGHENYLLPSSVLLQGLYLLSMTVTFVTSLFVLCHLLHCHSLLALIKEFMVIKRKSRQTNSNVPAATEGQESTQ